MSTVLTNGVIIPDNGSRNWGGDLANNWNILDVHVGYMTDVKNRVTTLENSVAENTANIQINASNISALQTSKQDNLSEQQIANIADVTNKANDSDVVHKSGNETISGVKTFSNQVSFPSDYYITTDTNDDSLRIIRDGTGHGNNYKVIIQGDSGKFFAPNGFIGNLQGTLNGINPGALSLPNCHEGVVVTSQVVNTDGIFQYTNNLYDGWLVVTAVADQARINNQTFECRGVKSTDTVVTVHIALRLNETANMLFVNFTNFAYVKLFKCLGNV